MKISLFQGILLGVFGLGALIGLVVFATYSSTGSSATAVGTVVIWGTLPADAMRNTLVEATRSDATMKGVSYVQKSQATFESDLISAIATGSGPDLVVISQEQLLPLNKVIQEIPAATLPVATYTATFASEGALFLAPDGSGTYGVPFLLDPLILYANRAILGSAGIAQTPSTWEALTGLVPKIASLTTTGQVVKGLIPLGTYSNIRNARGILSALFLQTGTPLSLMSGNGLRTANLGTTASVSGVSAGQAVLRFYTQFADPSKVSYTWNASLPDSQTAFINGDMALYIGYASEANFLRQANPNLDFEAAQLPQPATATTKTTYGVLYAFAIPRGALNPSGAYTAAATLTGSANQQIAASATGLAPVLRSLLGATPSEPVAATAYASAIYAKGWLSPAAADTDSVFSAMISNVISGRFTLPVALGAAERALTALLQK